MSWRENESLFCLECDEPLPEGSVALSAPHPFIPDREVEGCPRCREVTDLTVTCRWAGCTHMGTSGTPTPALLGAKIPLTGHRWRSESIAALPGVCAYLDQQNALERRTANKEK